MAAAICRVDSRGATPSQVPSAFATVGRREVLAGAVEFLARNTAIPVPISIGGAAATRAEETPPNELIARAEAMRYAAKHAGLTIPGAHKALKRLLQSGFILRVGGSRTHVPISDS